MLIRDKKEPFVLLFGDIALFVVALWLTLLIRYQGNMPSGLSFVGHLSPFSYLFIIWIFVFFIAGLYEKHTLFLKSRLPNILLNAQIINSIIAISFFYFIPYFGITPRGNLFLYLIVSFVLILAWRVYGHEIFFARKKQNAILIGGGAELEELRAEVNNNRRYTMCFTENYSLDQANQPSFIESIKNNIKENEVSIIAADLDNDALEKILPRLYDSVFSKIQFVDVKKIYEDIFDRVPLSLVRYTWLLENVSLAPQIMYDFFKRTMDISVSFVLGVFSLVLYPFVFVAIKLDDHGKVFIFQNRIGKNDKPIRIIKFRTLERDDQGSSVMKGDNKVTWVGNFLRKSRIDELPQLWNVFMGDLSLIGPRPELPTLTDLYENQIPYYKIRHLIKPGLSGWAQIYHEKPPKFGSDVESTKEKLSYDLYYIKNRSFILDVKIALRTLKILLSRSGL